MIADTRVAWWTPAAALMLLGPCRALPADLVFSGALERVRHESISVRLVNRILIEVRLPNAPELSARTITDQYNLGDHVRITCQPIVPVWEEEAFRFQYLALANLQNLGPPSPEELSQLIAIRPWRGSNLLKRPAAAGPATGVRQPGATGDAEARNKLEHARKINLEFAANLPNFTADEMATRYTSGANPPEWKTVDTLASEVSFRGAVADRRNILRNGKPWDRLFAALPGFTWHGGFGVELKPLFNPECPTKIEFEGRREARGTPLLAYRFSSPADECFGPFNFEYRKYVPARAGRILVNDPGGEVIRYEEEAIEFPTEFDFAYRKQEVTWDHVKIGEASYLLPVAAEYNVVYSAGYRWRVTLEYKNHRHS